VPEPLKAGRNKGASGSDLPGTTLTTMKPTTSLAASCAESVFVHSSTSSKLSALSQVRIILGYTFIIYPENKT
jgi:hypothetical protein